MEENHAPIEENNSVEGTDVPEVNSSIPNSIPKFVDTLPVKLLIEFVKFHSPICT